MNDHSGAKANSLRHHCELERATAPGAMPGFPQGGRMSALRGGHRRGHYLHRGMAELLSLLQTALSVFTPAAVKMCTAWRSFEQSPPRWV
jgi:hypothetical protein